MNIEGRRNSRNSIAYQIQKFLCLSAFMECVDGFNMYAYETEGRKEIDRFK